MQPTRSLIVGLSLGTLVNVCATTGAQAAKSSEADTQEMARQIQALRDQLNSLQRKLDAVQATEQQTQAQAAQAAQAAASAGASANAAAAAIPAEVHSAVEAEKPKTDKIYYKGVTLTLGGYGALETIYRTRNETSDMASTFIGIPFNNSSIGHAGEFRFSARQSRVTALAEGNPSDDVHLSFYGELDFLGAAQTANSNETNSYTPRIRVMYNQIDGADEGLHFLAGQNWSLATMQGKGMTPRSEIVIPTIDAQYVPGFTFTRQPGVRLTKDFDKTFWVGLSLENPQTTFYNGATAPAAITVTAPATTPPAGNAVTAPATVGSGFNSANTLSLNHVPDVIAKVAYDAPIADHNVHLEVFGLYRSFYERLKGVNDNSMGDGVGAGLNVQIVPNVLDFQVNGLGGKGIGRYGPGQLPDVTLDSAGAIKPIHEVTGLAGLTLHASPSLDIYTFVGEEKESSEPYYAVSAAGLLTGYGWGNPLYVNSGCNYEGAPGACVGNTRVIEQATGGFWWKPFQGPFGRYQVGLQYSYTERKAFAGATDIAPVAVDNMAFASFRYYPF